MGAALSGRRGTAPAFVPGIVAARAAPDPTTTIASDAAATLIPLVVFFSAISDSFRPGPRRATRGGHLLALPLLRCGQIFVLRGGPAITQMGDIEGVLPNRYRGDAVL